MEMPDAFVAAVRLAEPRFVAQPGLVDELARSAEQTAYTSKLRRIAETAYATAPVAAPPPEWIEAAYEIFSEAHPKHRLAFAAKVAADAWRTFHVLPPASGDE